MKFQINYIILKHNHNLNMNLILNKDNYQDKEHLEKFINVKVKLMKNNMQLNYCKLYMEIWILMKYLLYKIFKIIIIL